MNKIFITIGERTPVELEDFSVTRNVNHLEDDSDINQFLNLVLVKNTNMDIYFPIVGEQVGHVKIYSVSDEDTEETILYESDSWTTISEARCYLAQDKKSVRSELLLI